MSDEKKRMRRAAKRLGPKWLERLWDSFSKKRHVDSGQFIERLLTPDECAAELHRRREMTTRYPHMAYMPGSHRRARQ